MHLLSTGSHHLHPPSQQICQITIFLTHCFPPHNPFLMLHHISSLPFCFHFSPFIFHTPAISQIVNASKTGTIDYTLDTNVTLPDETRQTSCQIICSLTQFGFREHFVHTMSPKISKISCFPRKLTICRGNIVSGPPPPPLLMGTFLGYLGQLDCQGMTAIYSLFLFLQLPVSLSPPAGHILADLGLYGKGLYKCV